MNCTQCGKITTNPKFCSRACSAIYTNKESPKRKLTRKCSECDEIVKSYRHTRCTKHSEDWKNNHNKNKTIGEYRNKQSVKNKHQSWKHSHIRNFARSWNKELLKDAACQQCGYSKHVELAHIIPVSSFPDDALLRDVNSPANLKVLCPNCHWEFDNLR